MYAFFLAAWQSSPKLNAHSPGVKRRKDDRAVKGGIAHRFAMGEKSLSAGGRTLWAEKAESKLMSDSGSGDDR